MKRPPVDVLVVGAGPAGALSARLAAAAGLETLLLDRSDFPRWKVCGSCLNGAAHDVLLSMGLGGVPAVAAAVPLRGILVSGWGKEAAIGLEGSSALSRRALDLSLVRAATEAGATFLRGAAVDLGVLPGGMREVGFRGEGGQDAIRARVVVDATGLGGLPGSGGPGSLYRSTGQDRVGVGAVFPAPPEGHPMGWIRMFVGGAGYVGMVVLEDGTLDVAGALDRAWIRAHRKPASAVAELVLRAGGSLPEGDPVEGWQGTPSLSRAPVSVAEERLFRVGDAAGYVEPFTGEGLAWALGGASLLAPVVLEAVRRWHPALAHRWADVHRREILRRQRWCRGVAWLSRRPYLSRSAIRLSRWFPGPAARVALSLSRPFNLPPLPGPVPEADDR